MNQSATLNAHNRIVSNTLSSNSKLYQCRIPESTASPLQLTWHLITIFFIVSLYDLQFMPFFQIRNFSISESYISGTKHN